MGYAMNTAPIRREWVGRVVDGRFTLLEWLGGSERGGAFLTELAEPGARKATIKLIAAEAGLAEGRMAGWQAAAALSHPHLMRLHRMGAGQIDGTEFLYVVTEYGEEVLADVIRDRPLTLGEAREMLGPVLDTLSYLHEQGFVHGRLKPSNIMALDDCLKLSADSVQPAGWPGRVASPEVYDAPEAAAGTIGPAADAWSLGVTLVEVLTQHPPVGDANATTDPELPESVPEPFAEIARECLRRDPARRCTLSRVRELLEGGGQTHAKPAPARPVLTERTSVRRRVWVAALVLIAAVVILAAWLHRKRPPAPGAEEQQGTRAAEQAGQTPPPRNPGAEPKRGGELAGKGAVIERVLPDVPLSASRTIRGEVQLSIRVAVDAAGSVTNAAIDSPGPSRYFDKLALDASRRWKFSPPRAGGQAVSSAWVLHFVFRQSGIEVRPEEVSP